MLIRSNIKLDGLLRLENCSITRSGHEHLLYVPLLRRPPEVSKTVHHDLIKGDSAAYGEPHVVTPAESKSLSGDVDLTVHVVEEKKMEPTKKIGEQNFGLANTRVPAPNRSALLGSPSLELPCRRM